MKLENLITTENQHDQVKAKREVVNTTYAAIQRRLDRYRQVALGIATAFIPINTFFISVSIRNSSYLVFPEDVALFFFFICAFGVIIYFLYKLQRSFREMARIIHRCELHMGLHEQYLIGNEPLLFPQTFQPKLPESTNLSTPECPVGWDDPFIRHAIVIVWVMGVMGLVVTSLLLFDQIWSPLWSCMASTWR